MSEEASLLMGLLSYYNVPIETWGKGEAKTFDDLYAEIRTGETVLHYENDVIHRKTSVAAVDVYASCGAFTLWLREAKQMFADGRSRVRKRKYDVTFSLAEKVISDEPPIDAACRALWEELGIIETLPLISLGSVVDVTDSVSFPGLRSVFTFHKFETYLPSALFQPGYLEIQRDKTTHFAWDLVRL